MSSACYYADILNVGWCTFSYFIGNSTDIQCHVLIGNVALNCSGHTFFNKHSKGKMSQVLPAY